MARSPGLCFPARPSRTHRVTRDSLQPLRTGASGHPALRPLVRQHEPITQFWPVGQSRARRHLRSASQEVSLTAQNGHLKLVVSDNGEGFDARATGDEHLGLLGMREMAEGLGGRWQLTSTRQDGTRVEVLVPRKEALAAPARHAERSTA